jgi:acetyltransferase
MAPESVAFLGASNSLGKMGTSQLLNVLFNDFPGRVLPVHPREKEVLGLKAYPSIPELPEAPDLAILVVPSKLIISLMAELGELGTRHAIIMSAGFKETGEEGRALEKRLLEVCETYDMRFLGPNCMGVLNTHHPFNCTVSPFTGKPGALGLISQSGTYVAQTHQHLKKRGISLGKAISAGNSTSIGLEDCLEYLGGDEDTKAIALYIEAIERGDRFLELARDIARRKPIVAQYVGGTESGARSGRSHTGAMAGPDHVYDGLFEQSGVIRVETVEELYYAGHALANQPFPKHGRIGILTNSGGPATAMAMTLDKHGVEIPEFSPSLRRKIDPVIPPHGSSRNPVDVTLNRDRSTVSETLPTILMESDEIDGLLIHGAMDTGWMKNVYPSMRLATDMSLEAMVEGAKAPVDRLIGMPSKYGKPIVVSSFFQREDHASNACMDAGIPVLDGPEKAARAMAMLCEYSEIRKRATSQAPPLPERPPEAERIVAGKHPMDEFSAKAVLRAYGIGTCREILVDSAAEAGRAASQIGYPVAVKGCSPEFQHKTEAGIVYLDVEDEEGVKNACQEIERAVGRIPVLICEMVRGSREVIAGMTRLEGFPPAILFGLGGIYAEVLQDSAVRLAPFGRLEALRQIDSIKAAALLGAVRGMPPVDKEALADLLVSLGLLSLHFPEIAEIDLNPIVIVAGRPVVVDALFVG